MFFGAIGEVIAANIKWIVYAIIAIVVAYMSYKLYDTIRENGANQVVIETLQGQVGQYKKDLELAEKQTVLLNEVISNRDQDVQSLQQRLDGLTENLGSGENDPAPDSIKEYFKRLQQSETVYK